MVLTCVCAPSNLDFYRAPVVTSFQPCATCAQRCWHLVSSHLHVKRFLLGRIPSLTVVYMRVNNFMYKYEVLETSAIRISKAYTTSINRHVPCDKLQELGSS
jgi:hypothetical protein